MGTATILETLPMFVGVVKLPEASLNSTEKILPANTQSVKEKLTVTKLPAQIVFEVSEFVVMVGVQPILSPPKSLAKI